MLLSIDRPQLVWGEDGLGGQQSGVVVRELASTLNPQTRVGLLCKAHFDEQSRADRKDPGGVIDSSQLKGDW